MTYTHRRYLLVHFERPRFILSLKHRSFLIRLTKPWRIEINGVSFIDGVEVRSKRLLYRQYSWLWQFGEVA